MDGTFRMGGIGVVVKDVNGLCIAAFARPIPFALSPLQLEAKACRAGLLISMHPPWVVWYWPREWLRDLVSAVASFTLDYSEIGRILEDCKDYIVFYSFIIFNIFIVKQMVLLTV